MSDNVPPLSKVPGYRPAVPRPLEATNAGTAYLPGQLQYRRAWWTGPRTVAVSVVMAALVALVIALLLR